MRQENPRQGHPRFSTRARVMVICLTAVLGPVLTGFFMMAQMVITDHALLAGGSVIDAFRLLLLIVVIGLAIGVLPTLFAGLAGLWFFRHRPELPWWVFFAVGMAGLTLVGVGRAFLGSIHFFRAIADIPLALAQFFVPILLSASVCWFITRRWHSPRATP